MRIIDSAAVATALTPGRLLPALERMFCEGCTAPVRHHHTVSVPGAADATLLLMPAWSAGRYLGVKLATVFPSNADRSQPTVSAAYLLMAGLTGTALAMIDGDELTARRTAATSALAARFLVRTDARTLLIIGTGRIARELAHWHTATNPRLTRVLIWGRTPERAEHVASELAACGVAARAVTDLASAASSADVISSATLASEPLIRGEWIRPGMHVDLVGGFTHAMREADDELIRKARLFADTREGVLAQAGDLLVPIQRKVINAADVVGLDALCRGSDPGRRTHADITVFKSVGAALEDLAAAILVYESI